MKLYSYYFSSAAFRVRIALNLKGIEAEYIAIDLPGGENLAAAFRAINPQGRVPVLVDDDGLAMTQSLATVEHLEETHPTPPLLPADPAGRLRVRTIALAIACEIHPLNNSGTLRYLRDGLSISEDDRLVWYRHWIAEGLLYLETLLSDSATGRFCHGDDPTVADVFLVPQIFNAKRYDCPLDAYPAVMAVFDNCMAEDAFDRAQPMKQPDAPETGES